jgi:hypothetical protein
MICPDCRQKFNTPDEAAGKRVRCPSCQVIVSVPVAGEPIEGPPPLPKAAPPAPKDDAIAPANPRRTAYSETRPAKPTAAKSRRREEIDSGDDRPRRRRRPAQQQSSPMLWILAGIAVAAVLVLAIGGVFILTLRNQAVQAEVAARNEALVARQAVANAMAPAPDPAPALIAPVAVVPKPAPNNWTIVFRSNDPVIWGKDVNEGPDHRAISLTQVPNNIRYLRLRECVKDAFIIIEMTKDRLGKDSVQGDVGWNGTGRLEWNGRHVGVYNRAWDQLNKGDISFSTPAFFKGFKGWGFGHRIRDDDVQGYAWNGDALPRTVFEVAVTTEELTAAEREHLFAPTSKPPAAVVAKGGVNDGKPAAKAPTAATPKKVLKDVVAKADDKLPANPRPSASHLFRFDGKSRIVTPLERFAPVTLEVWFRPSRDPRGRGDRTQYLIGSDIPGHYGYGIGIRYDGKNIGGLQLETLRTFLNSNTPVSPVGWSHVAAVFGPNEVAMYHNGKQAFHENRNLEVLGGATFAIGKSGPDATVPFYYVGDIREIRISTGARYTGDFAPPPTFEKDPTSALIYRASETNGNTVLDLSGNGRHGQMDGVVALGVEDEAPPVVAAGKDPLPGGVKEFEPRSKRYTIEMPVGVKFEQASKIFPITLPPNIKPGKGLSPKPALTAEVAYSQMADGAKFNAAWIGFPAALLREVPEDKRFELYRDVFIKPANGRIVSEADLSQGRYKGKDYLIDLPNGQMRMQLLMLGGAGCFAYVETGSIERLAARDVEEYFASFKIKE